MVGRLDNAGPNAATVGYRRGRNMCSDRGNRARGTRGTIRACNERASATARCYTSHETREPLNDDAPAGQDRVKRASLLRAATARKIEEHQCSCSLATAKLQSNGRKSAVFRGRSRNPRGHEIPHQ